MPDPDAGHLDLARRLVADALPADSAGELAGAAADEDLRDYGLDSVRVMTVLDRLLERGADIEFVDLVGEPTLDRVAAALAGAGGRDTPPPPQTRP